MAQLAPTMTVKVDGKPQTRYIDHIIHGFGPRGWRPAWVVPETREGEVVEFINDTAIIRTPRNAYKERRQ